MENDGAFLLRQSAIVMGNAAYEAGNISGGALGLETILGNLSVSIVGLELKILPLLIGLVAFVLLYLGNYKVIERVLVAMVILMSLSFLITAIMTKPNLSAVLKNMVLPNFPEKSILTIVGIIGTTVVPYNLFLHASLAKTKWQSKSDINFARKDTIIAVVLGGIVSMCVIISASAIQTEDIANAADLAKGLCAE